MSERTPSKLFAQIAQAGVPDEDIAELYEDLKYIFESTFDTAVDEAITLRGAIYVEMPEQRPN